MATPSNGLCFLTASMTFSSGVARKASALDPATASMGLFLYDLLRAKDAASNGPS